MKIDMGAPEVIELFKEVQVAPERLFEIMRLDIKKIAGDYLGTLMKPEIAVHLNRRRYERCVMVLTTGTYKV